MKTAWIGLALLSIAGAAYAAQPDAATIAAQGNGKGATACSSCHGKDGGGQPAAGFPRLAGLDAAYLERQLDSFANGTRDIPAMATIAKALTPDERHALAEYYAHMPIPSAAAKGAAEPSSDKLGEELATRGMWSKQVPGCVKCHGPHGVGVGSNFPPLAGQPPKYVADQLRDWQQGKRKNDPLDLMQHVSSALSEADINAVAAWFSAQPAALKGSKP
ncbi:MAG: c-type cytochrome [Rhodanobacteraceae bacterium]